MIFYFAKHPTFELVGTASTSQTESIWLSDNGNQEGEYRSVSGGYCSYGATVYFQPDQSAHVKEMTAPGNYILYKDRNGASVWLTILTCEHDPLAGYDTITAEDASMDLINETVGAYTAPEAMTIADYISFFVTDSGFEIGINEIPDLARTLSWESEETTALARILSVATQFDAELNFRFEVSGIAVIKKYIDIRKSLGRDRREELTVDAQLNSIVTNTDVSDLYTSVYAIGSTPEGSDSAITLKGYNWTDPDGRYVLLADGSLRDPVANQTWSRLVDRAALTGGFINRIKTYEAQTQATLLNSALDGLKKSNHPAVTYTVDIAILPNDIQVGDTVHLRDEKEGLFLSARVLELTYSYSTETGAATLGDYLIEASQVDPQYRALAETLAKQNKGKDGVGLESSVVTYQAGTSGTTAPTGTWSETIPAVSPSQFLWARTVLTMTDGSSSTAYSVGKMGDTGKTGNGIQSSSVTYQVGTSGTTAPTGTWSTTVPNLVKGEYLWTRTIDSYTDGTTQTRYSVSYLGIDGQDITSYASGTDLPSTVAPANSQFWVVDSNNFVTAFYKSDGTKWILQPISATALSAATFNGITFNGVIFNGSEFNSTFTSQPMDGSELSGDDAKGTGITKMANGYFTADGTVDGTNQTFHTEVGPSGIGNQITGIDGTTIQNSVWLSRNSLDLYYRDSSVKYTGSIGAQLAEQLGNVGMLLWQGKTQLGDNQSITPLLPLSKCLNGWKIGLAIGGGNRFFWYYLAKEKALEAPNLGHLVPIFDFNVGGGGQYYYVSDTKLTGNTSINLNNSVGATYYIYEIRAF
ncbi:phage tail spike protein [Lacticaseibacillus paracasei]|uniref:phage tail spike protein n=1 Tax=Lacticaseibacillus paracasei TaxID=1597 RepID=UPI0031EC8F92